MAAPVFHAIGAVTASANNVTNTTLTPALPTRSTGDLLLCFAWSSSNGMAVATPSGWTLVSGFPKASGTSVGGKLYVFSDIVDGSETAPGCAFTALTTGTTGTPASTVVASYTNIDTATVVDGTVTLSDQTGSTTTVTIPSITTGHQNAMVIGFALKMGEFSATFTPPTGWNERLDALTTSGTGYQTEISDKVFSAAGATGSVTCAPSVTTSSRALGVTLALLQGPSILTPATVNATATVGATVTDVPAPPPAQGLNRYAVPVRDRQQHVLASRIFTQAAPSGAIKTVSGSVAATAIVSATVVKTAVLTPSVAATAAVTATVVKTAVLTPSVSATATVTATVTNVSGVASSPLGNVYYRTPVEYPVFETESRLLGPIITTGDQLLAGLVNATSTVTGTVVKTAVLSPSVNATATVSGTVVKTAVLSPSVSATSTVTGAVVKVAVLTPSVAATSAVSATVSIGITFSATVNATSTVSGAVVKTAVLAPSVSATSTVSLGSLVATRVLTGTVNATATVTATVTNTNAPVVPNTSNPAVWVHSYYH